MITVVKNPDALAAQKSLEVIIDLCEFTSNTAGACDLSAYPERTLAKTTDKRKLWADARSANVIATAVFSDNLKQRVTALTFFLHVDDQMAAVSTQAIRRRFRGLDFYP